MLLGIAVYDMNNGSLGHVPVPALPVMLSGSFCPTQLHVKCHAGHAICYKHSICSWIIVLFVALL